MKNAAALLEEYSMKRIISFFLCVLMTAALLAGCGDRKQRTTWIIAVDGDFSPFVCADANGEAVGLDVELLDAIARDQNFRYELRPSDWDTAMSVFTSHQAQVLMGSIASSQERIDGGWFFSHSFYNGVTQSMAMEPSSDTNTLEDLAGKAVAVVSGTLGAAYAESVKDKYGFSIATFSDSHSMYAAVLEGRAAACFEDTPALRGSIAGGVALELVPGSEGAASDYCVAICDEKDRPFLELFNQGLANIRANGIYDAILAKYADTL